MAGFTVDRNSCCCVGRHLGGVVGSLVTAFAERGRTGQGGSVTGRTLRRFVGACQRVVGSGMTESCFYPVFLRVTFGAICRKIEFFMVRSFIKLNLVAT